MPTGLKQSTRVTTNRKAVTSTMQTTMQQADTVRVVVPPNQIRLTDKELDADQTRMLSAANPNAPPNVMRFSFRDRGFRSDGIVPQTEFHLSVDSNLIFKEDSYAYFSKYDKHNKEVLLRNQFNFSNRGTQTFNAAPRDEEVVTNPPPLETSKGQFTRSVIYDHYKTHKKDSNDTDVAQTKGKMQERKIGDELDDPLIFSAPEGLIVDTHTLTLQKTDDNSISALASLSETEQKAVNGALFIAERLVSEIIYGEVLTDFSFWNDPSDAYKQDGSLLPLWKFATNFKGIVGDAPVVAASGSGQTAKITKPVSMIQFHPKYHDLFAVSYGSPDFQKTSIAQSSCISVFCLKNPFHCEKILKTPADVVCIDWHPVHDDLILCGLYDGNVAIFNLQTCKMLCISNSQSGKHSEAVWAVRWRTDLTGSSNNLSFLSGSADGTVCTWTVIKADLRLVSTMEVRDNATESDVAILPTKPQGPSSESASSALGAEHSNLHAKASVLITEKPGFANAKRQNEIANQTSPLAGVLAIQFNPALDWLYAIATDAGVVRLCSTAYFSTYVQTFSQNTHSMPVYGISWNRYNPDVLMSCSEDYTVKMWKKDRASPIYTIDMTSTVVDCCFSNVVSCEIIAGLANGNLVVYDFDQKRESPICVQTVVPSTSKLTKICLNDKYPIIAVGDNQGLVRVFKLSPNLRKRTEIEQPKARGANAPVYTPEDISRMVLESEKKKLDNFISWCIKANVASGID